VPGGRRDRTCVVVDTRRTATVEHADQFLELRTGSDFEALWIMRSLVRGLPLDAERVLADTGVSLAEWQALGEKLKNARFAVVLFDGQLSDGPAGHLQVDALWALVRDLNAHTRAAAAPLVPHGNSAGAAAAICARAAATSAVDFARGYPRFNHDEYSADRVLARGEVDAALVVGVDSLDGLSPAARKRLSAIPRVTFATHPQIAKGASVAFVTAPYGRASGGTIIRTDGVPLPLRPALAMSRPSDVDVLVRLEARVKQLCAARNAAIAEHARAAP
jgi:formylmethanofuran dehydrogenase subunit B